MLGCEATAPTEQAPLCSLNLAELKQEFISMHQLRLQSILSGHNVWALGKVQGRASGSGPGPGGGTGPQGALVCLRQNEVFTVDTQKGAARQRTLWH